jgi:hypothetical protein
LLAAANEVPKPTLQENVRVLARQQEAWELPGLL